MITRDDRIRGGIYGLLVGDALGVPYEFHDPYDLPPVDQIEMAPPPRFARAHASVPPATWSDDGSHALCLLASLLHCDGLDLEDLGRRLQNWWDQGYLSVDEPFDIGITTSSALSALARGVPAERSGPAGDRAIANGSLMRALPLALWHRGSDEALAADAQRQSLVTHGHPRAQLVCALYCLWARGILEERADPWGGAVATMRGHPELGEVLAFGPPRGSGYAVDTLHSARAAMEAGPYERVVRAAIAFGHDTDTTACVAGGVAGVRDGVQGIPARWLDALRGRDLVDPLVDALLARR